MEVGSSLIILSVKVTLILAEIFLQFNVLRPKIMKIFSHEVMPERLIVLFDQFFSQDVVVLEHFIVIFAAFFNKHLNKC